MPKSPMIRLCSQLRLSVGLPGSLAPLTQGPWPQVLPTKYAYATWEQVGTGTLA